MGHQGHETLSAATIIAKLERAGFKQTRPRQILAAQVAHMGAEGRDFTIEDLWRDVRASHPRLGRITAFRMIELLVKLGLVDRLAFPDGTLRYHVRQRETGYYVTCEMCHKVLEIQAPIVSYTLENLAQRSGFDLSGHHLEVFGRCPDCQKHP